MNILEVNNISKSFNQKNFVLNKCTFQLKIGTICAIVGESGSGKSTLFRIIAGLETPDSGEITINGKFVTTDSKLTSPQKRSIGMVFQDFALFPHLNVSQNISFGLKSNKKEITAELLKTIKMEKFSTRYPRELSGGQQQRVSLARTLATNPDLLLLDEPFSNIDAGIKSKLRKEIKSLVNNLDKSMVFITHDIFDAFDIADEIIFLKNGTIVKHCPIEDISNNINNDSIKKELMELKRNATVVLKTISNN